MSPDATNNLAKIDELISLTKTSLALLEAQKKEILDKENPPRVWYLRIKDRKPQRDRKKEILSQGITKVKIIKCIRSANINYGLYDAKRIADEHFRYIGHGEYVLTVRVEDFMTENAREILLNGVRELMSNNDGILEAYYTVE